MIRTTLTMLLAIFLTIGETPVPAQPASGESRTIVPGETLALANRLPDISSPRLVSRQFQTVAVWVEPDATGRNRIRELTVKDARTQSSPLAEAMRTVDQTSAGENSWPDAAINPANGDAGIVWLHMLDGQTRLLFREAEGNTSLVRETGNIVELPVISYDENGTPYIAWTEVVGGQSIVHAAVRTAEGWREYALPPTERRYDLFPQAFGEESGVDLFYYSLEQGDFVGKRFFLNPDGTINERDMPGDIPAERLPILYKTPEGYLGALWMEQTDLGEIYFELIPDENGEREVFELTNSDASISQVAVSEDPTATKVWVESAPDGGQSLHLRSLGGEEITYSVTPVASEPVVSASSNWIHSLWVREDIEEGTESLFYQRLSR